MENLDVRSAAIMRQLVEIASEAQNIIEAQRNRIADLEAESELESPLPYVMSVNDVAKVLQVSTQHVYGMCMRGRLQAVREGKRWLIMRDDFREYIKRFKVKAAS